MPTLRAREKIEEEIFEYDQPRECPICGLRINPQTIKTGRVNFEHNNSKELLTIVHQCPSPECQKYFTSIHLTYFEANKAIHRSCKLIFLYPSPCTTQILKNIEAVSPFAAKTYNQAMEAKVRGLDELVGIGIRKAIDYLLYDFGTMYHKMESKFNNDPKITLSQRINKFIESQMLKDLATACVWLGNDFTHPIRRHESKEISDLENFAESLFYHVNMVYVASTAKFQLEPPDGA